MEHKGTQVIRTERLILRPFCREDASAAYANWMADERVTAFLRWKPHADITVTEGVIGDWISSYSSNHFYQWAIVPKNLRQPIGSISVVGMEERTGKVHIGYCIGHSWWNQGYTSEAFGAIISFFFENVKAGRIESQHDPNNPHSGLVMKKCGLSFEGVMRKADWSNQGIVDAAIYGLLAEEYFGNKQREDC